jgi:hypothetical protein
VLRNAEGAEGNHYERWHYFAGLLPGSVRQCSRSPPRNSCEDIVAGNASATGIREPSCPCSGAPFPSSDPERPDDGSDRVGWELGLSPEGGEERDRGEPESRPCSGGGAGIG